MKIQYASDLHLEFEQNRAFVLEGGLRPAGDILVLAGDIGYLTATHALDAFWDWCDANFKQTIVVPGNHEYYGGSDVEALRSVELRLRERVAYHHNRVVRCDDVDVICSTLWSCVAPEAMAAALVKMPDYRKIRRGNARLTPENVNELHRACVDFVFEAVAQSRAAKTVVVTHHVPSFELVLPAYRDTPIASAFATELGDRIREAGPDVWIYGHSHASVCQTIGATRCVANQLGYVKRGEGKDFIPACCIDI